MKILPQTKDLGPRLLEKTDAENSPPLTVNQIIIRKFRLALSLGSDVTDSTITIVNAKVLIREVVIKTIKVQRECVMLLLRHVATHEPLRSSIK
jgi:hypothetical protein